MKTAIARGLCGRCPNCGIGKLFISYLKQQEACPHCAASFAGIRADDGPAWLTILITGHIVIPFYLILIENSPDNDQPPGWKMITGMLGLTIVVALLLLPRCKGAFIAVLWSLRHKRVSNAAI
jgi:uncharacterized protein (DUF983 family)